MVRTVTAQTVVSVQSPNLWHSGMNSTNMGSKTGTAADNLLLYVIVGLPVLFLCFPPVSSPPIIRTCQPCLPSAVLRWQDPLRPQVLGPMAWVDEWLLGSTQAEHRLWRPRRCSGPIVQWEFNTCGMRSSPKKQRYQRPYANQPDRLQKAPQMCIYYNDYI